MSTESLINCEHVSCTYGNAAVLDDVYMRVNRGEFVGVVGPSGSGKTTLLKAILGTHPVAHGSITMQPKLTLGYVPQVETVDWYFPVTVEEVIVMTRSRTTWWPRITADERAAVRDVLGKLGIADVAEIIGRLVHLVGVTQYFEHQPLAARPQPDELFLPA